MEGLAMRDIITVFLGFTALEFMALSLFATWRVYYWWKRMDITLKALRTEAQIEITYSKGEAQIHRTDDFTYPKSRTSFTRYIRTIKHN
jgi:hypothetical protein